MASVVNDSAPAGGQRLQGLDRLNAAERQALLLLAEGHTAKSIASTLDSTEAAVNERLREARRKTGVGSSRELARLLKAQENRDNLIGVGIAGRARTLVPPFDAEPWRPQTGALAMIAFFLVAAAGAAAMMSQAPVAGPLVDPLLERPMPKTTDPAEWHGKLRAEARDSVWAPRMEELIRARVLKIPLVGKAGNVLRVTCASTICEIAGTVATPSSKLEQEDQNSPSNVAIRDLQVAPLPDDLAKFGLKSESGLFTGAKGPPERSVFLIYYSRKS